ncbi:helix-turn-helix transcriptional regulator [Aureimonas sp. SA4125]|uniref:XRE family transcriptional regulator n=1 Tax=Aureimonas sp. SA4125 TaxID=2826993 RepID=UPI001CC46FC8|nr:helix-turn-helix transcriptional regulator [Aureimonas sp. SA4125]
MVETVGSVIRTARKSRGFVQRQLADVADVSIAAVGQWERGANDITMENLRKVAVLLGIDAEAANRGELRYVDAPVLLNEVERVTDSGFPTLGPMDIPVSGVSVGGDDADFTFNGQIVDHVRRPPGLINLKNVFALHVLGDSMAPRFEPADLVYCGGRPAVPGDDVVIEMFPSADSPAGKGYIKRLISRSASVIVVRQFNPPREIEFDPYEMKAMHRVIPWREVLGF